MTMKTSLTFEEKITAAYMHYVRKVEQQDIAVLYDVNQGRVSEACNTIKDALVDEHATVASILTGRTR